MRNITIAFSLLILLASTACSTEHESESKTNVIKDKIYDDQFNALHKAQQVEDILIDSAQNRQQLIDEQAGD